MRRGVTLIACVAAVLGAAGCGGSPSPSDATGASASTAPASTGASTGTVVPTTALPDPQAPTNPTSQQQRTESQEDLGITRPDVRVIGRSVLGRKIRVRVIGDANASHRVLVVGCIHGNEAAGEAITETLRRLRPRSGTSWWVVDQFNPDGCAANTRQNANGVDLNRNSPWNWQPIEAPGGTYYSGPGPLSEPESRAINSFVRRVRPAVSVWYHQHAALVDTSSGGDVAIERRYAEVSGLPLKDYGVFPGSITTWQDRTYPGDTAFCVELPAGALSRAAVARHVAAIREL